MPDRKSADAGLPRWGIVATVDEPACLLAAWVAHHLSVGASELHLFFDRPNPEAEALLDGIDRVILHHSGDDGWKGKRGKRPPQQVQRQSHNATRILTDTKLDWLVHCDADEFLHISSSFTEELATTDLRNDWLRLEVEERVWTSAGEGADIFAGAFRRPLRDFAETGSRLYGAQRAALLNFGLTGHDLGKSCARVGRGDIMRIHRPTNRDDSVRLRRGWSHAARVLHFDGLTRMHYIVKMLRRALTIADGIRVPSAPARYAQFDAAVDRARDPAALTKMWRDMQCVSETEAEMLTELGGLAEIPVGIVDATRALFGDRIDLSPAGFNRGWITHEADALAEIRKRTGFDPAPLIASS